MPKETTAGGVGAVGAVAGVGAAGGVRGVLGCGAAADRVAAATAGGAGGADVRAEAGLLLRPRRLVREIVEPGFAEPDGGTHGAGGGGMETMR